MGGDPNFLSLFQLCGSSGLYLGQVQHQLGLGELLRCLVWLVFPAQAICVEQHNAALPSTRIRDKGICTVDKGISTVDKGISTGPEELGLFRGRKSEEWPVALAKEFLQLQTNEPAEIPGFQD
ncbi:hypothetical protein HGM15179_015785 [Zosterops borbonicus]|uniref:Uncharacterized protein n=1 Tax=Zosterops borbonicus TaxID=364589 RepID=A0A8K1G441_9PASS|nr:hypothetical protein HGM15179_015785 [Zosterops borbonicus]